MINLDLKDRKILYQLDVNARQSNAQIAKKVQLSKEAVHYRIKKLEASGVIKYFIAIIDSTKLDYLLFRVFLKFNGLNIEKENEILAYLKDKVSWIVTVEGDWDFNIAVWVKDIYEYKDFWDVFFIKYGTYLLKKEESIITKMWHYRRAYLLNAKSDSSKFDLWGEKPEKIDLDPVDYAILNIIATNGRLAGMEIAKKIKQSERVVRYRIKRMIKEKVILGFRAFLDINKLGYTYFKLHFALQNLNEKSKAKLLTFCHLNPNIIYLTEAVGGPDFELDVQVKNNSELYVLIDEIRKTFVNQIKDYEFMQYTEEHKFRYLPV